MLKNKIETEVQAVTVSTLILTPRGILERTENDYFQAVPGGVMASARMRGLAAL